MPRFLFGENMHQYGGEWKGCQGFGMMLNHTYPMASPDWPGSGTGRTWIEFDPFSLVLTLIVAFSIFFLIFSLRYKAKKNIQEQANMVKR